MASRCCSCAAGLLVVVAAAVCAGVVIAGPERGAIAGVEWDITYRARSDLNGPLQVQYKYTKGRYIWNDRSLREQDVKNVPSGWSKEIELATNRQAMVVVSPHAGQIAHCEILLDGLKVLANERSPAPGKPAVCAARPK